MYSTQLTFGKCKMIYCIYLVVQSMIWFFEERDIGKKYWFLVQGYLEKQQSYLWSDLRDCLVFQLWTSFDRLLEHAGRFSICCNMRMLWKRVSYQIDIDMWLKFLFFSICCDVRMLWKRVWYQLNLNMWLKFHFLTYWF